MTCEKEFSLEITGVGTCPFTSISWGSVSIEGDSDLTPAGSFCSGYANGVAVFSGSQIVGTTVYSGAQYDGTIRLVGSINNTTSPAFGCSSAFSVTINSSESGAVFSEHVNDATGSGAFDFSVTVPASTSATLTITVTITGGGAQPYCDCQTTGSVELCFA